MANTQRAMSPGQAGRTLQAMQKENVQLQRSNLQQNKLILHQGQQISGCIHAFKQLGKNAGGRGGTTQQVRLTGLAKRGGRRGRKRSTGFGPGTAGL